MLKATAHAMDLDYDSDDRLMLRNFAMLLRNNTIDESSSIVLLRRIRSLSALMGLPAQEGVAF
jgi:hypothetical protein